MSRRRVRERDGWHRPSPQGFSLLKMVMAAGVTGVIVLGLGSAMLLASRAMPDVHGPAVESAAGAEAMESIASELQYAIAVKQRSASLIEFTTAARNGDEMPEVIRYEWSGAVGAPLTRKYNAGTAATVLSDTRDFNLSYDLQTISTQVPQGNESAETLLIAYDSSSNYHDYTIKDTEWYSEYFYPTLPANAVSWKVTRVRFYSKQAGLLGGETSVQLQTPTAGGLPSGVVLQEKTMYESLLPLLYLAQEVTYTQVNNLSPQQGLCLVFKWRATGDACKLLGQDQNVTPTNIGLAKSTDRGASWGTLSGQSLLFRVYGTVTTSGTPQIQSTYYLNAVGIRLRAGADTQAGLQTSVRTPQPAGGDAVEDL